MKIRRNILPKTLVLIACVLLFPGLLFAAYGDTSTYMSKIYVGDGGSPKDAYLDFAEDLTFNSSGEMFIADTYNNVVRKINTSNKISTLAGSGSYGDRTGSTENAEFALPGGVAIDSSNNVYVADTHNHKVKKISGGNVSTLIGSGLSYPKGLTVRGSTLYISDTGNNAVKKISTSGGSVSNVATGINSPRKLITDSSGQYLYVVEAGKYRMLKVRISSGSKSVVAGSGSPGYVNATGTSAKFRNIAGVTLDSSRNTLYVTDGNGYTDYVRKINLSTNSVTTLAADAAMATINYPKGIASKGDYVYVANSGIGTVQKFNKDTAANDLVAGKNRFNHQFGSKGSSLVGRPNDMVFSPDGKYIYLAENNFVRRIKVSDGSTSFIIGSVVDAYRDGRGVNARFSSISGITINNAGNRLYVADRWNNRIRGINLDNNTSYLISGGGKTNCSSSCNGYKEGSKNVARFNNPSGITISPDSQYLYVTDTSNNRVRKVRISDGQTWLVAGSGAAGIADAKGSNAMFNRPYGITIDSSGKYLYVADSNNHRIRRVEISNNDVKIIAGNGNNGYRDAIGLTASLSYPEHIKYGADGNLYFSEVGSQLIKFIDLNTKSVRTVSGKTDRGFYNGELKETRFNNPKGLLPDTLHNKLYVADNWNDLIRVVSIPGSPPYGTPAPQPTSVSPRDRFTPASSSDQSLFLEINGSNFEHRAQVMFNSCAMKQTFVNASNKLTVELPFGIMLPSYYDVKVRNLDGQIGTCNNCFIVLNPDGSLPPDIKAEESQLDFNAYDAGLRGGYYVNSGNVIGGALSPNEILTGTEEGFGPQVSIFDGNGNAKIRFFAYASHLRSGVRVAACDLNNDGTEEIVTVPGKGGRPHIRIFNGNGDPVIHPGFFALDGKFLGGANITCGDVNADGVAEIIVSASQGGGPHVTVHNYKGETIASFMAYDKSFRGGIRLGTADFNNDDRYEIITGPENGSPHVQMFNTLPDIVKRLNPGFYAFYPDFKGGLSITGGDVNGDGNEEIIVSQRTGGQAWVKVYTGQDQSILKTFLAYEPSFQGGAVVAAGDTDGDGKDEVMTMPGSGGSPQVRIFDIE